MYIHIQIHVHAGICLFVCEYHYSCIYVETEKAKQFQGDPGQKEPEGATLFTASERQSNSAPGFVNGPLRFYMFRMVPSVLLIRTAIYIHVLENAQRDR